MKTLLGLVVALIVTSTGIAHADTYNQCLKAGDAASGIYFEQGYAQTSPNSSDHFFENIVVVNKGKETRFKIKGDRLYTADCNPAAGAISQLSLDKKYYSRLEARFNCGDGKSFVEVKFDLSSGSKPNGAVSGRARDGSQFAFDLNCE